MGTQRGGQRCPRCEERSRAECRRHAEFPHPHLLLVGTGPGAEVTQGSNSGVGPEAFADDADIALFYFAGHGYIEDTGGFLCASDCQSGDDGLSLAEPMSLANLSKAKNKVIILDSCHGGIAGTSALSQNIAEISDGVTILTASTADQYAMETPGGGSGVFTSLFVDALSGAAANLVGAITLEASMRIDQSLDLGATPSFQDQRKDLHLIAGGHCAN